MFNLHAPEFLVAVGNNSQQMTKDKNADLSIVCFGFAIALCVGILYPSTSSAQTDTAKSKQLNEVQINAQRFNLLLKSPTPMQVLGGADLSRINSLSVADAVRYFSGVQLKDYGAIGGLKTINVRSMGTNHTNIFYNGIQLGNAQNGQVDLGKYSLDNLEEISLYSGQKSASLLPASSYAAASSIYLKTKIPIFKNGERFHLNSGFRSGSFGLVNPSLLYQQKISDSLSLTISSEWLHANGRYNFRYTNGSYDTTAVRNNGDVDRLRMEASIFGNFPQNGRWNAQIYAFNSERGLPGATISNKFDYQQRAWDENIFVQGSVQQELTSKLSFLVNAKLSYDYTRFLDPEYISVKGFLDNRFHERDAYISAAANYKLTKGVDLNFASDYQFQDLKANIYRFAYPTRETYLNVLAAKFNNTNFSIETNLLSTTLNDKVELYTSAGHKQVFSPSMLFSWKPFTQSNLRFRGFYKDIFRMPTFNDLYYTFVGNTLLNPEYTEQYDLGFTFAKMMENKCLRYFEVQADVYYNQIKDKIIAQPGANLMRWIMYNVGKVEIKGLDVNMKSSFLIQKDITVTTSVAYTFQQAIDVTRRTDDNYRDQIPYAPKHSGSFLTKIDYRNWKLNYSFIYTGSRYNQKANIIYNYMEPWYTHDAAIGYQFRRKMSAFDINVELNNLLNQYYDVIPNFPMPGRNFRLSLKYSI